MNLRYSGKLTKEEYLTYVKLSNRPLLKKDSSHIDMWILFISIGSFLSLMGLVALFQGSSSNSGFFPWYLPQLIIGIIIIGLGLKFRGALSKYWEENKESLSNVNGVISDENVEIYTPNGNLKVDWSELHGYGEHMKMIVLYKPPVFAIPFLERFFEKQEDWDTFKKFVVDNLALTHRINQGASSKSKTAYILLSISMIVIFLYLYLKLKGG
jgi:hypothetical protein